MASTFPGAIDNFTDPLANSSLASPSHAGQHSDLNDAVEKIETYMGLVKVIPTAATNGTVGATGNVTIGNAVTSVSVTTFSSLYDHYKIMVTGIATSVNNQLRLTFGATTTGYFYGNPLTTMAGGAYDKNFGSNVAFIDLGAMRSDVSNDWSFEILSPFRTTKTKVVGFGYMNSADFGGLGNGMVFNDLSYTSFTLTASSGTMTGGTIRVYGYRN